MAAKRGIAVSRAIIVGSTSTPLSEVERITAPPDHTHRWTVAVRSPASHALPTIIVAADGTVQTSGVGDTSGSGTAGQKGVHTRAKDDQLDFHKMVGGKDDLSYMIKRVQFKLHDTYQQPTRNIDKPPFQVTETGWGEFEIVIKIYFVSESGEKPITLYHHLKLHPWLPPIVKPAGSKKEEDLAALAAQQAKELAAQKPPPVVHSWQYEEIVFPEPTEMFYDILIANPPSPLPTLSADTMADPDTYESWVQSVIKANQASTGTSKKHKAGSTDSTGYPSHEGPETESMERTRILSNVLTLSTHAIIGQHPHPIHAPTGTPFPSLSQEAVQGETYRIEVARGMALNELERERTALITAEKKMRDIRKKIDEITKRERELAEAA
ncbi:NuA4 histone H4 acetyltransferase complex and the SWR1 complex subunit [Tilletia horrida]|nr:NuA4 histone H4 acetyltransferase complex and the SWR1 complex subunit [Tilletia horrida]